MNEGVLAGKVVLITGAGGSIGAAVARAAAAEGAAVVVNDLGVSVDGAAGADGNVAAALAAEIGPRAVADGGSVADADAARAMVARAVSAFGRLDALINVAGVISLTKVHRISEDEWRRSIDINLNGAFLVSRAAIDQFIAQGQGGSIVHFTSTAALIGNWGFAHYASGKMGVVGLSRSIAMGLRRQGIRSNCIAPMAWSRMLALVPDDTPERAGQVDLLRQLKPEKVAPLAVGLCADSAVDVSGQIFTVRNDEIFIMSQPRPVRGIHNGDGWTPESVGSKVLPALAGSFTPLEATEGVFTWPPL